MWVPPPRECSGHFRLATFYWATVHHKCKKDDIATHRGSWWCSPTSNFYSLLDPTIISICLCADDLGLPQPMTWFLVNHMVCDGRFMCGGERFFPSGFGNNFLAQAFSTSVVCFFNWVLNFLPISPIYESTQFIQGHSYIALVMFSGSLLSLGCTSSEAKSFKFFLWWWN